MASLKCFVPLMFCVLLATLCIASVKPIGEESDKKSIKTALSDEAIKAKLTAQLEEMEKDVDDFRKLAFDISHRNKLVKDFVSFELEILVKKIDELDSELDEITAIPDIQKGESETATEHIAKKPEEQNSTEPSV
ncbi:hypothetical protein TSAR_002705 [Trichomalopsis sarcophagae]|uniref:Uncharacterized protein n=1 Tax=Trichomalopsis sarcophagae TaxID=543379 RepID=A0A232EYD4_9HYME|nr:hypothetical protein TSAR_002705 [Trichomalopsis sarcophagae]